MAVDAQLRALSSAVADAMDIAESELEEYTDDDVSVHSDNVAETIDACLDAHMKDRIFPSAECFEAAIKAREDAPLSASGVLAVRLGAAAPIAAAVDELLVRASLKAGFERVLVHDELDALRYAASVEFDGDVTRVFRVLPDGHTSCLTAVRRSCLQEKEKELIRRLVGVTAYANLVSGAGTFADRPSVYVGDVSGEQLASGFRQAASLLLDWEL